MSPVTVRHRSTYVKPHAYSEGIRYVLVNGRLAVDEGEVKGVLSGQLLTPPSGGRRVRTGGQGRISR